MRYALTFIHNNNSRFHVPPYSCSPILMFTSCVTKYAKCFIRGYLVIRDNLCFSSANVKQTVIQPQFDWVMTVIKTLYLLRYACCHNDICLVQTSTLVLFAHDLKELSMVLCTQSYQQWSFNLGSCKVNPWDIKHQCHQLDFLQQHVQFHLQNRLKPSSDHGRCLPVIYNSFSETNNLNECFDFGRQSSAKTTCFVSKFTRRDI